MENENIKIPIWFWIVSVFFLLWNVLGIFSFYQHTFISDEALSQLSEQERALYGEYPLWTTIVFAIATLGGLLGSVGLVLRKKWSKMAFIISLLAVLPQMIHNVFFTKAIEVYGLAQAVTMPVLVVLIALFLVWFSYYSLRQSWYKN